MVLEDRFESKKNLLYPVSNPGVAYDPMQGFFWRLSSEGEPERKLELDADNMLIYFCPVLKKSIKKKGLILAWNILHGAVPKDSVVYAKDCNPRNLKSFNIGCTSKESYKIIKDSLENLNGAVRLVPHPNDSFAYYLRYRKDGKVQQQKYHDIVTALKAKAKILQNSTKLAGKYLISS